MQCIFWDREINLISENKVIFNIDEATYNNSVKCNYAWLPKGESSPIINTNIAGKMNIIFGLATDGNWMAILSDSTNDSIKFWKYLLILKSFIDYWMDVKCENVRFTMDNAPIHVSSKTKKAAEELGMKWLLLPAYSPLLAPAGWVFNEQEDTRLSK